MNLLHRPVRIGLMVLVVLLTLSTVVLTISACGSDNHSKESKNPPGENATTSTVATTTTTTTEPPKTNFQTLSRGVDRTDYKDYEIWHGKIDGVECIRYGDHFMCKGFAPA